MDELEKALFELSNVLSRYVNEVAENIEELKRIKTSTEQSLGADSMGAKVVAQLESISTKLAGSCDEVAGLLNRVDRKKDEIESINNSGL